MHSGKLTIDLSGKTEIGVSRANSETYSSHKNFTLQGNITYKLNERHSVELTAKHRKDGPNKDLLKMISTISSTDTLGIKDDYFGKLPVSPMTLMISRAALLLASGSFLKTLKKG